MRSGSILPANDPALRPGCALAMVPERATERGHVFSVCMWHYLCYDDLQSTVYYLSPDWQEARRESP